MRHHAKFCQNRANDGKDSIIFRFSTWRCLDLHAWSHPRHSFTYSNYFHRNPSRVFGATERGVEICRFPLLWRLAFTAVCTNVQDVIFTA